MFFKNNIQFNEQFYLITQIHNFTITANGMGVLGVGILVSPHQVGTH